MIAAKVLEVFPRDQQLAIRARANEYLTEAEWRELFNASLLTQWFSILDQRAKKASRSRQKFVDYRVRLMSNAASSRHMNPRRIR